MLLILIRLLLYPKYLKGHGLFWGMIVRMKALLIAIILWLPSLVLGQNATLVRIVDGDTLLVEINGITERVRVVGIDAPESVATNRPIGCFGKEASAHARTLLEKSRITLETETGTDDRDKYDRLLRYITYYPPDEKTLGQDFGYRMIHDGYAYAYNRFGHARENQYTLAQLSAQKNKHGLWADNACDDEEKSMEATTASIRWILKTFREIVSLILKLVPYMT